MTTTLAHQLANYSCSFQFEDLSKEVVHEVKRRVIDSLGCALGAWNEEPCVIARKVASDFSAKHGATIIGTDHKAPPDWAAFANGCCIRYFDYNDTYLSKEPAHPERQYCRGAGRGGKRGRKWARIDHRDRDCLRSAMPFLRRGQHSRARAGTIRLTAHSRRRWRARSLMKLDPEKTRHAVNIAGVNCAALRQARVGELSHWKGVAFANAARHGVYAALLARAGMTGPAPIFEGQMGFEKELGVSLGNVGEVLKVPRGDRRTKDRPR